MTPGDRPAHDLSIEHLQSSLAGVRQLVRSLLFDEGRVDDVVQEVWVAALENAPRNRESVGAWVRTVVQRLILRENSKARARGERERLVARGEAVPSTADFVERENVRAHVVDALLSLDEPHRTVLRLRYFEELSIPKIARVLDCPRETVRTQLKRGLKKLRWRLDDLHGGDRRRWQLALIPLGVRNALGPPTILSSWLGRPRTFLTALTTLSVLFLALWLGGAFQQPSPEPEHPPRPSISALETPPSGRAPRISRDEARSTAHRPASAESSGDVGEFLTSSAVVAGRLVSPEGDPLPRMALTLGIERRYTGDLPSGKSLDGLARRFVTDEEGRFEHVFPVEPVHRYDLRAGGEAFCPVVFTWEELKPGTRLALGDVALRRGGRIVGTFVDREGVPIERGWTMTWRRMEVREFGQRRSVDRTIEGRAGSGGRFVLDHVDPGRWRLELALSGRDPEIFATHAVREGRVTEVPLRYFGVPLEDELVVVFEVRGWHGKSTWMPAPEHVRVVSANGEEHTAQRISREFQERLRFTGLGEGPHRLVIDDPRFVPFEREDVAMGETLHVTLDGKASLEWIVRDERGEPVEDYRLAVRRGIDTEAALEGVLVFRAGRWFLPVDGLETQGPRGVTVLSNLVGGDYQFFVSAPGHATERVIVRALGAEERRSLQVTLRKACAVAGRLRANDPVNWDVALFEAPVERHPRIVRPVLLPFPSLEVLGEALHWTRPGDGGEFRFEGVTPGTYDLVAFRRESNADWMRTGCLERSLRVAGDVAEVDLEEPSGSWLEGRLLAPPTAQFEGLLLELRLPEAPLSVRGFERIPSEYPGLEGSDWVQDHPSEHGIPPVLRARVATDGTFRMGPIAPGRAELRLSWDPVPLPLGVEKKIPRSSVALGDITFRVEELVEREYDLRDRLPGALSVQVHTIEGPAVGYRVVVLPESSGVPEALGWTGSDGGTATMFVPAGKKRLRIECLDGYFSHPVPGFHEVRSAAKEQFEVTLPTLSLRFPILDGDTQERLPNHAFHFLPLAEVHPPGTHVRILFGNADGTLTLQLVPGRYLLRSLHAKDPFPNTLDDIDPRDLLTWTPSGPEKGSFRVYLHR